MVSSGVPERPKLTSGLRRIARINAWLLLVVVALLIFTGWGITHTAIIYKVTFGLVDRGLADAIHKAVNLPLALFFSTHVLINVRLMVTVRNPKRVLPVNLLFALVGLLALAIFAYVEYFG